MAQRRMKTSGKIIIGAVVIVGLIVTLKLTGIWDTMFPDRKVKDSSIPVIEGVTDKALPGTKQVRLAHWTWNSHQAWAHANGGKTTKPDSIFAKNGLSVQFARVEEIPLQIAALKAFAEAFDDGEEQPSKGVHFFTIMGDAGGWVLNDTNKALRDVDSDFQAEIIGFSGFSSGEDKFMGLPEWKKDPQTARGGLVAGVAADGDWNIMIFWCAQNQIPFNPDTRYYDPGAVNFLETDSYVQAGEVYIAGKPVERIFKADGVDYKGNPVKKGDKGFVEINGVVTWTPVDKNIADQKGGLVSIVSTKEYSNQMPQYIIGLKQWNEKNQGTVVKMLASIFEASDEILEADKKLDRGALVPKSAADARWTAAQRTYEIFDSENPDYWYKYYDVNTVRDKKGLTVEVGGSSVSNLSRNIKFFGLDGGADIGAVVHKRFAELAKHYYPDFIDSYPAWDKAFNPAYIKGVANQYPQLAASDAGLPTFTGAAGGTQLGELTYRIAFASGSANFTGEANSVLKEALSQLVIAANSRVEIHGHTDSEGAEAANMALSQRRGQAVADWLKQNAGSSFPAGRVRVIPHGESQLLVQDVVDGQPNPAKMAQNRRVVLKIFSN